MPPSSELIGTALLFYPPTKACSFRKASYPPAEELLQSLFTAAAERSQHPFFFSLTHLHTGIIPDSVRARFVQFKATSLSKFYFHVFLILFYVIFLFFLPCFSGMGSPDDRILVWTFSLEGRGAGKRCPNWICFDSLSVSLSAVWCPSGK